MKHFFMSLFLGVLFFLLTPGVLVVLPPNMTGLNGFYIVAATHALVFALVYYVTKKIIKKMFYRTEGFRRTATSTSSDDSEDDLSAGSKCKNNKDCSSNSCKHPEGTCQSTKTPGLAQSPAKKCNSSKDCNTNFKCEKPPKVCQ
jgi:hypothetical protein